MATRGGKPASRRAAQKSAPPKTIDLKASGDESAPKNKPAAGSLPNAPKRTAGSEASAKPKAPLEKAKAGPAAATDARERQTDAPKQEAPQETARAAKRPDPTRQASQPTAVASSGLKTLVGAGLAGGVAAVALLGLIGSWSGAASLPLIGNLYQASDTASHAEDLAQLQTENAQLQQRLGALEDASSNQPAIDGAAIESRLTALEDNRALADETTGLVQTNAQAIDQLNQQLTELDSRAPGSVDGQAAIEALKQTLSDLSAKIAALEEVSPSVSADQLTDLTEKLNGLTEDLDGLRQSQKAVSDQFAEALDSRLAATAQRIDGIDQTLKNAVLSRLDEVVNAAQKATANEKIARSVAVASLQSAIDNGTPYLNALTSIETLGGASEETGRLRALAGGEAIPTLAQLQSAFNELAPRLIHPTDAVTQDEGLLNRFVASARSLVSVRPSTPQPGTSPGAVVSRIEAHLKAGNLGEVETEWAALPEDSRNLGAPWIEQLKRRFETNQLLQRVLEQANASANQG